MATTTTTTTTKINQLTNNIGKTEQRIRYNLDHLYCHQNQTTSSAATTTTTTSIVPQLITTKSKSQSTVDNNNSSALLTINNCNQQTVSSITSGGVQQQIKTNHDLINIFKENKQLKSMLLLHLDLIQEQNEQLIIKDNDISLLKKENQILKEKISLFNDTIKQQQINHQLNNKKNELKQSVGSAGQSMLASCSSQQQLIQIPSSQSQQQHNHQIFKINNKKQLFHNNLSNSNIVSSGSGQNCSGGTIIGEQNGQFINKIVLQRVVQQQQQHKTIKLNNNHEDHLNTTLINPSQTGVADQNYQQTSTIKNIESSIYNGASNCIKLEENFKIKEEDPDPEEIEDNDYKLRKTNEDNKLNASGTILKEDKQLVVENYGNTNLINKNIEKLQQQIITVKEDFKNGNIDTELGDIFQEIQETDIELKNFTSIEREKELEEQVVYDRIEENQKEELQLRVEEEEEEDDDTVYFSKKKLKKNSQNYLIDEEDELREEVKVRDNRLTELKLMRKREKLLTNHNKQRKKIILKQKCYISTKCEYNSREWIQAEPEHEFSVLECPPKSQPKSIEMINLEVPCWTIVKDDNCLKKQSEDNLKIVEDTSNECFLKRHRKFEIEEKRRKKWDVQRIREQRKIERLKLRHCKSELIDEMNTKNAKNMFTSFFPMCNSVKCIAIVDELPVQAFGENIPFLNSYEFALPWMSSSSSTILPVNSKPQTLQSIRRHKPRIKKQKSNKREKNNLKSKKNQGVEGNSGCAGDLSILHLKSRIELVRTKNSRKSTELSELVTFSSKLQRLNSTERKS